MNHQRIAHFLLSLASLSWCGQLLSILIAVCSLSGPFCWDSQDKTEKAQALKSDRVKFTSSSSTCELVSYWWGPWEVEIRVSTLGAPSALPCSAGSGRVPSPPRSYPVALLKLQGGGGFVRKALSLQKTPSVSYLSGTSDYEECYLDNKLNFISHNMCGLSVDKVCFSFGFLKYCKYTFHPILHVSEPARSPR